jgi:hypothetical protein
MTVEPNLPPSRLFDDQELQVVLDLENLGATDLGGVGDKIYLSGFDPNIITGIPTTGVQIPQMRGKDEFGPGDIGTVSFEAQIRSLGFRNVDKYDARLVMTACYDYESIASDTVCVDPDPFSGDRADKACTPRSVSMSGSQGGPIAVTSVNVEPSPGRTRFEIDVSNVGGGDVFRPGGQNLQKCSPYSPPASLRTELDYVLVRDISISGVSIMQSCRPLDNQYLRLVNGRGTIFCEYSNIPGNAAFTTPLTVELEYGYRDSETRDITVLRSS